MKATSGKHLAPADLRPEDVTAVIDSREQDPLDLTPLRSIGGSLTTGDYSVVGLEHVIAIERKSLPDLLACVGRERERFEREMMRLVAYPTRAIVVEGEWADLERGDWRSQVTPAAAIGSLLGWMAMGIPVILAGDHERAGRMVSRVLCIAARRRYRESRALVQAVEKGRAPPSTATSFAVLESEGIPTGVFPEVLQSGDQLRVQG